MYPYAISMLQNLLENVAKDLQSGMFFSTTFCFYLFWFWIWYSCCLCLLHLYVDVYRFSFFY